MGVLLFDPDLEPFKTRLNRVIVVFFFNSSKIRLKEKLAHPRTQIVENSHLSVYSKSTYLLNTHTLFLKLKEVYFFKKKKKRYTFSHCDISEIRVSLRADACRRDCQEHQDSQSEGHQLERKFQRQ